MLWWKKTKNYLLVLQLISNAISDSEKADLHLKKKIFKKQAIIGHYK